MVNKIVAGLDPPFCHVELQFPSGEACSIVMSGRVSMRARRFDPEFYTGVRVEAPAPAVGRALALARRHVALETAFGVGGARTFCSKLVADLLRESGMVREEELGGALLLSPSALHRRLAALALSRARKSPLAPAGPLAPIAFAETAVQPSCPPRHGASPVAFSDLFSGPCVHLKTHNKASNKANNKASNRTGDMTENKKEPEERRLLLAA